MCLVGLTGERFPLLDLGQVPKSFLGYYSLAYGVHVKLQSDVPANELSVHLLCFPDGRTLKVQLAIRLLRLVVPPPVQLRLRSSLTKFVLFSAATGLRR